MQLPIIGSDVRSGPTHTCKCRQRVAVVDVGGAKLWSDSHVVTEKLTAALPAADASQGVFLIEGPDWAAQVQAAVALFSPLERASIRAAFVDTSGACDPWKAMSVDNLIIQGETAWFPEVINGGRLLSHLQPIARVGNGSTYGYESLARAVVNGKLMNGGQIVDAARAHGALFQFDQISRTAAIRSCGPKLVGDERLFINFLPMVIYDPIICLQSCWNAAKDAGVSLSSLVFEVVESEQFPDIKHLRRILDTYKSHGAGVALDDLGTGHTSLSYIDELAPNYVKLAKGLIPERPHPVDLHMVRGLVKHAKSRGITVLAEGIETADQLSAARDLDVDLVQGWLIGHPAAEPVRTPAAIRMAA